MDRVKWTGTRRRVNVRPMRAARVLLAIAAVIGPAAQSSAPSAHAQSTSAAQADDPGVEVDPASGARFRRARPEPGPRRGELTVQAWVPLALGAAAALFALSVLGVAAFRRSGRRG